MDVYYRTKLGLFPGFISRNSLDVCTPSFFRKAGFIRHSIFRRPTSALCFCIGNTQYHFRSRSRGFGPMEQRFGPFPSPLSSPFRLPGPENLLEGRFNSQFFLGIAPYFGSFCLDLSGSFSNWPAANVIGCRAMPVFPSSIPAQSISLVHGRHISAFIFVHAG